MRKRQGPSVYIKGLSEKEEGSRKIIEEIMAKSFLNLMKTVNSQIQEAQWNANPRNTKKNPPKHIVIKLLKTTKGIRYLLLRDNLPQT